MILTLNDIIEMAEDLENGNTITMADMSDKPATLMDVFKQQ